jgi:hypothetical protein
MTLRRGGVIPEAAYESASHRPSYRVDGIGRKPLQQRWARASFGNERLTPAVSAFCAGRRADGG